MIRRAPLALALLILLAAGCGGSKPPPPPILRGLADFHSHQFAHLGFGGKLHSHDVQSSGPCRPVPRYDSTSFVLRDLVRATLFGESKDQADDGQCYPTWANLTGQQMDVNSLKRAWRYGLRLQVVLAVNSEFMCEEAGLGDVPIGGGHGPAQPPPRPRTSTCLDPPAIDAQLKAAHDLEKQIDDEAGGPGKGWYRIVETPDEARQVINKGKLAVVLGVEAANAFQGCQLSRTGSVPGIPGILGGAGHEATFDIRCQPPDPALKGSEAAFATAYFEHYWDEGARHFFLIHNLPGVAGGNSLSIPLLHASQNPSRLRAGHLFNKVDDIDRVLAAARPPVTSRACGYDFDQPATGAPGRCDSRGLTATGIALARMMGDYGAIIDIDHLSLRAKLELRGEPGIGAAYPVVSSHSGFAAISHGDQKNEDQLDQAMTDDVIKWGGAFAPILHQGKSPGDLDTFPPTATTATQGCGGTSEGFVQAYRYIVSRLTAVTRADGTMPFVGVGYGSDFDGLAGWPAPRFSTSTAVEGFIDLKSAFVGGSTTGPTGYCYPAIGANFPTEPGHVAYPFTGPDGTVFGRSSLPWSGRPDPYDISSDGVAHVGMIPDFVEELKAEGLTDADLAPLWRGAEAYVRTWQETSSWAGSFTDEVRRGVRDVCRAARAELVNTKAITAEVVAAWKQALQKMRDNACYGAPAAEPGSTPTPTPATPTPTASSGPLTAVPNVVGATAAAAKATLTGAGFTAITERIIDATCEHIGDVVTQSPVAGTQLAAGKPVTIRVGAKSPTKPCP